jgi:hypothetical protein
VPSGWNSVDERGREYSMRLRARMVKTYFSLLLRPVAVNSVSSPGT